MKKITLKLSLILFIFLSFSSQIFAQDSNDKPFSFRTKKIVKSIEIEGNKAIGIATVLARIKTRVGQEYLENVISDDIKRLYNTGFFSDVSVDHKDFEGGFKVIFYIKEKAIIEDITFSKTRFYKPKRLQKKITSKKGKFLDKKTLKDDVDLIQELYTKKGLTMAKVEVDTFVDEVTNKVSLHFIIKEGYRVKVRRIKVFDNLAFSDRKVLKVIKSRKAWLFNSGYLKEDVLDEDMNRIKEFYEKEGYIDAIADYELEYLGKGRAAVKINVYEGKRYYVDEIMAEGNSIVTEQKIKRTMENTFVGGIYSRENLEKDVSKVRELYFDRGYIFAQVREAVSLNPDTGNVSVKLDVIEGDLAYLEKIKVQGNTRTRDVVVRRELRMYPGDQFDGEKLRRSKQKLKDMGYFEEVDFDMEDTRYSDRKNLVVQVKEAKTGSFSFGGGYSTVDEVVGFVEVEQRNFDFTNWPNFTGGGQRLTLRAETGSTRNNARLSFTEPWLWDYPVSGGFDLYRSSRDRERDIGYAYDEDRTGGVLRFGKDLSEYVSGAVKYRLEKVEIENMDIDVSSDLKAEEGENDLSLIGFTLEQDKRDSSVNPTKGLFLGGDFELAGGMLGGDKDFYRVQTRTSYYVPLKFESVVEFRLRTGFVDDYDDTTKVPIFERFFAGGARTIRGYDERKVGPLDSGTNDPVGGESLLVGNIEYTIPVLEFMKLAAFYDAGNVWAKIDDFGKNKIYSGTGAGLRIKTPIGPISLDYGYPLDDEPGEESRSGKFYFSISRGF